MTFTNDEQAITWIAPSDGALPLNFYSVINPKNFFEIFKPAIVSQ